MGFVHCENSSYNTMSCESDDPSWTPEDDGDSEDQYEDMYDVFLLSVRPDRRLRGDVRNGCNGHDAAFSCRNCWRGLFV